MCAPVAALAAGGAVLSAIGTGIGALQANQTARYQARMAERNAAMEREATQQDIANTEETRQAYYRKLSATRAEQELSAAASGVSVNFGTAADVMADTDMLGREDLRRINEQGNQRVRGRDITVSNYLGEASAQRQAGKGALIKGVFDMGSTVLGGAQQYKKLRADG